MPQFDEQSIRRIIRVVLDSERRNRTHQVRSKRGRNYPWNTTTVLYAYVNEASHVTSADASFDVDNVTCLSGYFTESSITGVNNTFNEFMSDDAPLILAWNGTDKQWEVIRNGTARNLYALINEAGGVATSDADFDVDNVAAQDGYYKPTSITGVKNTFSWEGDNNGKVWIVIKNDGTYQCTQMECPA